MNDFDARNGGLITNTSIKEYFHDSVNEAIANQQIQASAETAYYLVNLLTAFSRSERLFEKGGRAFVGCLSCTGEQVTYAIDHSGCLT